MNLETGKCLDADNNKKNPVVIEKDCNPSTTNRWKLLNGGKQLFHVSSAQCLSLPLNNRSHVPIFSLQNMVGDAKGNPCQYCWIPKKVTQHVFVVNNQIRFLYGMQKNATERLNCMATSEQPIFGRSTVTVEFCNDSYKNHTWSFVSFE